jgi:DNA polymerase I-like protein with 3'-5' exonuclease and polymerase domains
MPTADMMFDAEWRGVPINVKKMDDAEKYLKEELRKAEKELIEYGQINWGSPKQIGELLYGELGIKCPQKTPKGKPSTSESTLNQIDHPCVGALFRYRGAKQQLSFFIEGWKPYLINNRLHPSFKVHGTVTGRLSCENPNLQQVPRDPRIRALIDPQVDESGYELIEADLSQVEVRITAELANERKFVEAFLKKEDVHLRTALHMLSHSGDYTLVMKTAKAYLNHCGLDQSQESAQIIVELFKGVDNAEHSRHLILAVQNVDEDMRLLQKVISTISQERSILLRGVSVHSKTDTIEGRKIKTRSSSEGNEYKSESPELERWKKKLGNPKISEGILRSLWRYYEAYGTSSHRRGRDKQSDLKLSDALFIVSQAGPSFCEEVDPTWKEQRKLAKALVFGLIYGMWWKKLIIYARDNYGITLKPQDAESFRKAFFELYQDLPAWHSQQKRFAHEYGYVKSLSGRKRRLPDAMHWDDTPARAEAQRQAINSPVQSFANELNLMSAIQLTKEFRPPILYLIGTVHDAVLLEVKKEYVPVVYKRILQIMQHPDMLDDFGIKLSVPIEAEAKVGPWSLGTKLEKWLATRS